MFGEATEPLAYGARVCAPVAWIGREPARVRAMQPRRLPRESLAMNPKAIARRTIDAEMHEAHQEAQAPKALGKEGT